MSTVTPTTKEVSDNIIAQLESSLNQTIPLLPKSFNRVLSKVLGAVFVILYKYGGFMALQIFVRTASTKETEVNGALVTPLVAWGRLRGAEDPLEATKAELLIDVTVTTQAGILPSNSQLVNVDNGVTYLTLGDIALDAPLIQVTARAESDQSGGGGLGALGNLSPGDIVSFANPLANVARNAVVDSQVVTAANAESFDLYRQRVIDLFQKPPRGGAYSDYEFWGEGVAGIINVYPYTSDCPGQVEVYVEATEASSGSPDGIPTAAQLQAVLDAIEFDDDGLASRRPATALANTHPITRTAFDVEVLGLVVDNLSDVQDQITVAVGEYFLSRAPFIVGLSVPPRRDRVTSSGVAGTVEDIVSAAGGIFTTVSVTQAASLIEVYSLGIGEKAKAGSVTFL